MLIIVLIVLVVSCCFRYLTALQIASSIAETSLPLILTDMHLYLGHVMLQHVKDFIHHLEVWKIIREKNNYLLLCVECIDVNLISKTNASVF